MKLRPILLGVRSEEEPRSASPDCAFCGAVRGDAPCSSTSEPADRSGRPGLASPAGPACALCHLARNLGRPRIDDEGTIVWLPELSQAALNIMVREMHLQLLRLGEPVRRDAPPVLDRPAQASLQTARCALEDRALAAVERVGTDRPSEVAAALWRLPNGGGAARAGLLSQLRLLPFGRFYDGADDVYPDILRSWGAAAAAPAAAAGA